mmetsp:Transcript_46134/g.128320  ORF Transcript_46134/g.128320 Transcript_46134/m.128320 type:complete len:263 (+) Transcript_46134:864-1652(+)
MKLNDGVGCQESKLVAPHGEATTQDIRKAHIRVSVRANIDYVRRLSVVPFQVPSEMLQSHGCAVLDPNRRQVARRSQAASCGAAGGRTPQALSSNPWPRGRARRLARTAAHIYEDSLVHFAGRPSHEPIELLLWYCSVGARVVEARLETNGLNAQERRTNGPNHFARPAVDVAERPRLHLVGRPLNVNAFGLLRHHFFCQRIVEDRGVVHAFHPNPAVEMRAGRVPGRQGWARRLGGQPPRRWRRGGAARRRPLTRRRGVRA